MLVDHDRVGINMNFDTEPGDTFDVRDGNIEISNGERQFARKCSVCHTLRADGKKRAGPSLHKVFGREAGTLEGYVYSEALIKSKIVWNENSISKLFEDGPDKVTPGTKMPIQKMKNKKDRLDLVLFLKEATK